VPEEEGTTSGHSEQGLRPEPGIASHQEPSQMRSGDNEVLPHPSTDQEGEQQMQELPPVEAEPSAAELAAIAEAVTAKADASESNTAGSGVDLGCPDPAHVRQFEQLIRMRVFSPNVAGSALGVTGPDE
jgi:hypothetical protein